jgi:hypothetical protein
MPSRRRAAVVLGLLALCLFCFAAVTLAGAAVPLPTAAPIGDPRPAGDGTGAGGGIVAVLVAIALLFAFDVGRAEK